MKRILAIGLLFTLSSHLCHAMERRTYTCYAMSEAPLIDGNLNEQAWAHIPSETAFENINGGYTAFQSKVKIGWYKDKIFIGLTCFESEIENFKRHPPSEDNSIELFFDDITSSGYFQYIITTQGCQGCFKDGFHKAAGQDLSAIDAKVFIGTDFWSMEVSIPFSLIGLSPKEADSVLMNIGRNRRTLGKLGENFTFAHLSGQRGYHDPGYFATLTFSKDFLTPEQATRIEEASPKLLQYRDVISAQLQKALQMNSETKKVLDDALTSDKFKENAALLKKEIAAAGDFQRSLELTPTSLPGPASVMLSIETLYKRISDFKYQVLLAMLLEER